MSIFQSAVPKKGSPPVPRASEGFMTTVFSSADPAGAIT